MIHSRLICTVCKCNRCARHCMGVGVIVMTLEIWEIKCWSLPDQTLWMEKWLIKGRPFAPRFYLHVKQKFLHLRGSISINPRLENYYYCYLLLILMNQYLLNCDGGNVLKSNFFCQFSGNSVKIDASFGFKLGQWDSSRHEKRDVNLTRFCFLYITLSHSNGFKLILICSNWIFWEKVGYVNHLVLKMACEHFVLK